MDTMKNEETKTTEEKPEPKVSRSMAGIEYPLCDLTGYAKINFEPMMPIEHDHMRKGWTYGHKYDAMSGREYTVIYFQGPHPREDELVTTVFGHLSNDEAYIAASTYCHGVESGWKQCEEHKTAELRKLEELKRIINA
jgi:hypothetical protein